MSISKIWGRLPVWLLLSISTLGQSPTSNWFKLTATTDGQQLDNVLTDRYSSNNIHSSLQCGVQCLISRSESAQQPLCEGYLFEPTNKSCVLYSDIVVHDGGGGSSSDDDDNVKYIYAYTRQDVDFEEVFVNFQSFHYYTPEDAMSYDEARDFCRSVGGYLVYIDSNIEIIAMAHWMTLISPSSDRYFWIGANDKETENQFVSEKYGTVITNPIWHWAFEEPNNYGDNEHCLQMKRFTTLVHDSVCDREDLFICEKDG